MKIYTIIAQFVCMSLLLTSVTPLHGQFAPIEAQPNMRKYVEDKFNTAWKQLEDFKNCFTGKKECSRQEKRVKTAVVMGALLVVLSLLLFIVKQGPKIIGTRIKERTLDDEIKNIAAQIEQLRPTIGKLSKSLIRRDYVKGMQLQPGDTIQPYTTTQVMPDPVDPKNNILVEVKKQMVIPAEDPETQKIVDIFTNAAQKLEDVQHAMQQEVTSEKKRQKTVGKLEGDLKDLQTNITKLQKALMVQALPQ